MLHVYFPNDNRMKGVSFHPIIVGGTFKVSDRDSQAIFPRLYDVVLFYYSHSIVPGGLPVIS